MTRLLPLPRRTSHTEQGPLITIEGQAALVRYDCVEQGVIEWTELSFDDVLMLSYREMAACGERDIGGPDYVVEEDATKELGEAVGRWAASVGWQRYEKGRHEMAPFKSFRVFFDNAGAIQVLARGVEIVYPARAR